MVIIVVTRPTGWSLVSDGANKKSNSHWNTLIGGAKDVFWRELAKSFLAAILAFAVTKDCGDSPRTFVFSTPTVMLFILLITYIIFHITYIMLSIQWCWSRCLYMYDYGDMRSLQSAFWVWWGIERRVGRLVGRGVDRSEFLMERANGSMVGSGVGCVVGWVDGFMVASRSVWAHSFVKVVCVQHIPR